jgi:hypothetical protein
MKVSKDIYRKDEMTWQIFRDFLLVVTDINGVVNKPLAKTAKNHKLYRWGDISLIIKKGNKIFNGESDVHINTVAKNYFHKYMTYEYPKRQGHKDIKQITLPFDREREMTPSPKIGCKLTPPPHIIKDVIKGTTTIVPQGKEQEFIESTKVAQPQQRRQFILIILWGLLTIKF